MTTTRRSFLIASGLTALASTRVFGANERLRLGIIGAGERMKGLLNSADTAGAYEIVAVLCKYELTGGKIIKETGRRKPSIHKRSTGNFGLGPRLISHTVKKNYFIGVGSGILAVAR